LNIYVWHNLTAICGKRVFKVEIKGTSFKILSWSAVEVLKLRYENVKGIERRLEYDLRLWHYLGITNIK